MHYNYWKTSKTILLEIIVDIKDCWITMKNNDLRWDLTWRNWSFPVQMSPYLDEIQNTR